MMLKVAEVSDDELALVKEGLPSVRLHEFRVWRRGWFLALWSAAMFVFAPGWDDQLNSWFAAARDGNADQIQRLCREGMEPNITNDNGDTALHLAARHGHADTLRAILVCGANIDALDGEGYTPLMLAARHGHANTVSALLEAGADVQAADARGRNALALARAGGHEKTAARLLQAGAREAAPIGGRTDSGWTPGGTGGPPGTPPAGGADPANDLVIDDTGWLHSAERKQIRDSLRSFQARMGINAAVVLTDIHSVDQAQETAGRYFDDLVRQGRLRSPGAVFLFGVEGVRAYKRDLAADRIAGIEEVKLAWTSLDMNKPLLRRVAELLERIRQRSDGEFAGSPETGTSASGVSSADGGRDADRTLAQVEIGSNGGRVETPREITLTFPAGALEQAETVTVTSTAASGLTGRFYAITTSGGEGLFNRPVTVDFPLPPGRSAAEFTPVQQLAGPLWQVLPADTSQPGVLRAQLMHFSGAGIVDNGRTWNQGVGTAIGAGAGTLLLIAAGAGTAPVSGPMAAWVLFCSAGGWFLGGQVYDHALMENALGPVPIDGFQLYLDQSDLPAGPRVRVWVNKLNGRLIGMTDPAEAISGRDQTPTIGPPRRRLGATITFPDGTVIDRDAVATFPLPVSVLYLGRQLQQNRRWYEHQGYKTPEQTPVLVTPRVGAASGGGREVNSGEWLPDAKILLVNSRTLPPAGELEQFFRQQTIRSGEMEITSPESRSDHPLLSENLRATLAHEYWHALWPVNGFREVFPGAEESAAVSFESLLCPDSADFLRLYPWSGVAPVLRAGLIMPESGEDPFKRGYQLWPWIKFLLHAQGDAALRDFLHNRLESSAVQALYRTFCHKILVVEDDIADPAPVPDLFGGEALSRTGWKDIDLKAMARSCGLDTLAMGRNALPMTRPLSLSILQASLPAAPAGQGRNPVIVRRYSPLSFEEIAVLKPSTTASGNIVRSPSMDGLEREMSAAFAPAEWFSGDGSAFLPFAVIGCQPAFAPIDQAPLKATEPNPLLVYRLASPEISAIQPIPSVSNPDVEFGISFQPPAPGKNLQAADVLAGYRLLGRNSGGFVSVLAEYVFDRRPAPHAFPWWYRPAPRAKTIPADARGVSIRQQVLEPFTECALVSMDARIREGDQPLCSTPLWREWRPKPARWVLTDTRVEDQFNRDPATPADSKGQAREAVTVEFSASGFSYSYAAQFELSPNWKPRDMLSAQQTPRRMRSSGSATFSWSAPPQEVSPGQSVPMRITLEQGPHTFEKDPPNANMAWAPIRIPENGSALGQYHLGHSARPLEVLGLAQPGSANGTFTSPSEGATWEITVNVRLSGIINRGHGTITYRYELKK